MASAFSSQTQEMSTNMRDLVKCILCNSSEISSTLKMFPCFYSACTDCIQNRLQGIEPGDRFECVGCYKDHCMADEGIHGFDDNFLAANMKFLSDVLGNNPPKCWACETIEEDTPSSTYCLTCQNHFCPSDGKKHMGTTGHQVITHGEFSTEGIIPKLLSSHSGKCEDSEIHEEPRPYKHYCLECQTLSCSDCLTYKHEGHEKMPLKKAGEKFGEELKKMVSEAEKSKVKKVEYLKTLNINLSKMKQNKDITAQEIKSFGDEVKKMVDKLVKEKLENLESDANKAQEDFKKAMDEVTRDRNTLKMAEQHMDIFLTHSSHVNILHKYGVFKKNLETCHDNVKDTVMVEAKAFHFHHETQFEIQRSLTKMFHGIELQDTDTIVSYYAEFFDGIAVDENSNDIIAVKGQNVKIFGMDGNKKGLIHCQGLRSACAVAVHDHVIYIVDEDNGEVVAFDRNGNRKKCIIIPELQFVWQNLGFAINPVNGDLYISSHEKGSVFKCPLTGTQLQPFITKGLNNPCHLCVIPNKGLVVSNRYSHEIHMYSFEGTLLWKYGSQGKGDEQFQYPGEVCTDHLDNIFVADEHNSRIHYISSDGKLLKHIAIEGRPKGLAMKNDRLVVTSPINEKILFLRSNYIII